MNTKPVDVEALRGHTPGPWRYETGGGHAPNRIVGADSVQVSGWGEDRGGVSNRSYSDCVCENLGNIELPCPAANARLIASAPDLLAEVIERRAQADEDAYVIEQLGKLLARIAVAVKGPDGELTRHSYHDLPERVESLIAEVIALRAELAAKDAAVAELVEAADRTTAAFRALGKTKFVRDWVSARQECEGSMLALNVALANFRGAK